MNVVYAKRKVSVTGGWLQSRRQRLFLQRAMAYILLTVGGAVMMVPFFWLVTSALKAPSKIYILPPQWIPDPVRWDNFHRAVQEIPYGLYTYNTLVITVCAVVGSVVSSSMAGYAFARLRWPGRNVFFMIILSTLMLPGVVTMIPTYVLYNRLRWLDTFLPLIVPYWFGGGAFNIFLMRQFMLNIPTEMLEAARMDGASEFALFSRIVMPNARAGIGVIATLSLRSNWNALLWPQLVISDPQKQLLMPAIVIHNKLMGSPFFRTETCGI